MIGLVMLATSLVVAATASAVGLPPGAVTGSATAVSATAATVSATVNPAGQATTYAFEYGTTTAYGQKTAPQAAGSGVTTVPASANIAGLSPATTYHYRVTATNPSGTTTGADQTFATTAAPPAPSAPTAVTGAATAVTATTATLSGTVNPQSQATTYAFQYGATAAYGNQTPPQSAGSGATAAPVSANITGLTPGTTYHYRVIATNATGTTTGADQTFATPAPATTPPTVATGVPTNANRHGATLTGTVNPNGATTSYVFQFGLTSGYRFETLPITITAASTPRTVTAVLDGLQSSRIFHYRLVAINAGGTSLGKDQTFTTGPNRLAATSVSATTTPGRATAYPYRFVTSGTVAAPGGVDHARACRGFVAIRFKSGNNTISLRRTALTPSCTYSSHVTFHIPRRVRSGVLHVYVLFEGNGVLTRRSAPVQRVLVG